MDIKIFRNGMLFGIVGAVLTLRGGKLRQRVGDRQKCSRQRHWHRGDKHRAFVYVYDVLADMPKAYRTGGILK